MVISELNHYCCVCFHCEHINPVRVSTVCYIHSSFRGLVLSEILICPDKRGNIALLQGFLIFWRCASAIPNKPMAFIVLHKADATPLDLIWLKIATQNDRKVLQFFHFPASEAPVPSKRYKMPLVQWHKIMPFSQQRHIFLAQFFSNILHVKSSMVCQHSHADGQQTAVLLVY